MTTTTLDHSESCPICGWTLWWRWCSMCTNPDPDATTTTNASRCENCNGTSRVWYCHNQANHLRQRNINPR